MKKNSRSKLNKGKTLGIVAASLATISLAGVGYASWTIADAGKKEDTGTISVSAGDVVNGSTVSIVSFKSHLTDGKVDTLKFDSRPRSNKPDETYLFSNVTEKNEDLEVKMDLEVKALKSSLTDNKVYYGVKINGYDENNGFGLAIKNKWIANPSNLGTTEYPTTPTISGTISGEPDTDGFITDTISVTITFTWGALFKNTNPIDWVVGSGEKVSEGQEKKVTDAQIIKAVKDLHDTLSPSPSSSSLTLDVKVSNKAITNS